ncbi:sigma-54-dependent transcriptional regulator [Thaumasiovibrio subtropicus]|uniref:sigma-54-dependent transcriptional regulator n=1 Tax=Thaumasiovibrio subtropicus TaxID=1891207 RepID=UPI000B36321E|nr:sigma-54 dependent transcriptional regulator [Thaumasiovibrio subtropicus]
MMLTEDVQVLLIDDDNDVLDAYQNLLQLSGYKTVACSDPTQVMAMIPTNWAGVVVSDMYMPGLSGMDLLQKIQQFDEELPVVIITGHGDIPMAVDAVKKGAVDFLTKPLQPPALLKKLKELLEQREKLIGQRRSLSDRASTELIGDTPPMLQIKQQIADVAAHSKDILLEGEPGTGRHSAARLIHSESSAKYQSLISASGQSIQSQGALQQVLKQAARGGVLLHNPQLMPVEIQRWLCHTLLEQERLNRKEYRIFAIIDGSAEQEVEQNSLLPELYYYLSQCKLSLPAVRHRIKDIVPLFNHFLEQSCIKLNKEQPRVEQAYVKRLQQHDWQGNVLEIKNIAELYAIGIVKLAGNERTQPIEQISSPLDDLIDGYEKQVIEDALFLFSGRINEVASYLQIPRKKLYLRMKKHNLDKAEYKVRGS